MDRLSRIQKLFSCPNCRGKLESVGNTLVCIECKKKFQKREGRVFFSSLPADFRESHSDDLVYRLKRFLKQYPKIFFVIYNLVSIFVGKRPANVIAEEQIDAVILNIGSGAKRINDRVVNVDIAPESGVDVVASAYGLPFQDGSIDLVISESLLEHLEHPDSAVAEMHRVLKPGGRLYILTPFMLGFHSSPNDFYRWTIPGMKILLKNFSVTESGVAIGPTSAMLAMLREWLAILLSFNNKTLYQIWTLFFMVLFIPFNWLDFLLARYSYASQIALAYYWIAEKK